MDNSHSLPKSTSKIVKMAGLTNRECQMLATIREHDTIRAPRDSLYEYKNANALRMLFKGWNFSALEKFDTLNGITHFIDHNYTYVFNLLGAKILNQKIKTNQAAKNNIDSYTDTNDTVSYLWSVILDGVKSLLKEQFEESNVCYDNDQPHYDNLEKQMTQLATTNADITKYIISCGYGASSKNIQAYAENSFYAKSLYSHYQRAYTYLWKINLITNIIYADLSIINTNLPYDNSDLKTLFIGFFADQCFQEHVALLNQQLSDSNLAYLLTDHVGDYGSKQQKLEANVNKSFDYVIAKVLASLRLCLRESVKKDQELTDNVQQKLAQQNTESQTDNAKADNIFDKYLRMNKIANKINKNAGDE